MTKISIGIKKIELTERDVEIFKLINRYGYIKKSVLANQFKNEGTSYKNSHIRNRFLLLNKAGYLKSVGRSFGLTTKSKEELTLRGIDLVYRSNIPTRLIKGNYKDSEVLLDLGLKNKSRKEFINEQIESGRLVENVRRFSGIVYSNKEEYLVYRLDKVTGLEYRLIAKDVSNSNIRNVLIVNDDIEDIIDEYEKRGNIRNFIILMNNENFYEAFRLYMKGKATKKYLFDYISSKSKDIFKIDENANITTKYELEEVKTFNLFMIDILELVAKIEYIRFLNIKVVYFIILKDEKNIDLENLLEKLLPNVKVGFITIALDKYKEFYEFS